MKTPHPTPRAVYYVNWTDLTTALALTDYEMEQADTALGQRFTWGDAGLTLAEVAVVRDTLTRILDPREVEAMLTTFDAAARRHRAQSAPAGARAGRGAGRPRHRVGRSCVVPLDVAHHVV